MNKKDKDYKQQWVKERVARRNHSIIMLVIVGLGTILKESKELGTMWTIILLIFLVIVILVIFKVYTSKEENK
ncbi:hypothetical protein [Anaerophilus nitritogenes]|uniref:hypothetical protein n=1 Tax=Anaerophilus nitritogenes TaxID=2498136 RepID=UPI00101B6067|nr:hypothetical protein [Anaerophilus nitritogenes]